MTYSSDFQIQGTDKFELLISVDRDTFFNLVKQAANHQLHVDEYCIEALKALAEDDIDFMRFYTIGETSTETTDTIAF